MYLPVVVPRCARVRRWVRAMGADSTLERGRAPASVASGGGAADPKMIFLADTICCKVSAATVAKRPGFSKVVAVKDGEVIGLNDSVASRWGPRLSLLMNQLTASVKGALKNPKLWK